MHGVSEFAIRVRKEWESAILPYWRATAYGIATPLILGYLSPIVAYFRAGTDKPAPVKVQRRITSAPLVVAIIGFIPWCMSAVFFPLSTLYRYGRWQADLVSQQM